MAVDYPGMARLAMAHIPVGDNSLRVVESMLSLLKAGGVSDQAAAYAADLIGSYTTAIAYEQSSTQRSTTTPSTWSARSGASPSASPASHASAIRRSPRLARR